MGHTTAAAVSGRTTAHRRQPSAWPFKEHTSDFGVGVPRRQEVEFKDGKRIWVSSVMRNGTPDLFLRELGMPAAGVQIDLRRLINDVERELPQTSTRDVAGFVAISLRLRFPTLDAFIQHVVQQPRAE